MPRIPRAAVFVAISLGGCATWSTDGGELQMSGGGDVWADGWGFRNDGPVLVGSEICPDVTCVADGCPAGDFWSCLAVSADGPGHVDGQCLVVDGPGLVTWRFDPQPCDAADASLVADQVAIEGVDPADARARVAFWTEEVAPDVLTPAGRDAFPDDWVPSAGEPVRVMAGELVALGFELQSQDDRPVGYRPSDVAFSATAGASAMAGDPGTVLVNVPAGVSATITATIGEQTYPLGTVVGVDASEVTSLEVVGATLSSDDGETSQPMGARAVLRDADGHPVFGAPVEWSVHGGRVALYVGQEAGLPGDDYVQANDACRPPPTDAPEERSVTLVARFQGLRDEVGLDWVAPTGDPDSFQADDHCAGSPGCGCDSGATPSGAASALLAAVFALSSRRRGSFGRGRRGYFGWR